MDLIAFIPVLIAAILSIAGYILSPRHMEKGRWIFVILIIASLAFSWVILEQQERKELELSGSGVISSPGGIIYPCLIAGGNVLTSSPDGLSFVDFSQGINLGIGNKPKEQLHSSQDETDKITVWIDNSRLKVSSVFRDRDGKILARIVKNEWNTAQKPLIFDRNFDDSSVEVVDTYGNVVLQVDIAGSCAKVSGVFYNKLGNITVNDSGIFLNPIEKVKIEPIFIYPSERHLGERIK